MKIKEGLTIVLLAALFLGASFYSTAFTDWFRDQLYVSGPWAMLVYVVLTVAAVVVAPFSTVPLIPVAVSLWGIFWAVVLSVFAWTTGALIAFYLARRYGQAFLSRFVNVEKLDGWRNRLPKADVFVVVVLFRMVFPVDVLSYALGLFTKISYKTYVSATFLGVIPFAIVFAYASTLSIWMQLAAFVLGLLVFLIGYKYSARK